LETVSSKVLFITPGCYDKGGISRYNRYQIKSLIDLFGKNNVRVLSLYGPGLDNLKDEFEVHWHGTSNNLTSKIGLLFQFIRQLFIWKPDFVFIGHVNLSGVILILSKMSSIKTILNIYGLEVWGSLSTDARYGLSKVDYVISDCHFTANFVKQSGLRDSGNIEVVWDCVDLEIFRPRTDQYNLIRNRYLLPPRDRNFILLTLGRVSVDAAYKGYERLIELFYCLYKKYLNVNLVIAGKGDLIPKLKSMALEKGIEDRVFFTGSIDEDDMAGIYSYAHLFSLVSHRDHESGEGIPLTPLEAMACGTPIMVGNQDGSQEAIFTGRNGMVVDPFNLKEQIAFIEDLILNEDKRQVMSEEAMNLAAEYFSYETFKAKHHHFLNKIKL
jgi:phosphatidylinositol alpha-1,6-mannosyltransferase